MNEIAQEFNFLGYDLDGDTGRVLFRYQLLWDKPNAKRGKELTFTETFLFGSGYDWDLTARKLLDVLYFVAGVSYYKAGLPSRLNFKNMPVSSSEAALTAAVYSRGLEEMAYRNNLELPGLSFFDAAGAAVVSGSGESHPGAVLPWRLVARGGRRWPRRGWPLPGGEETRRRRTVSGGSLALAGSGG